MSDLVDRATKRPTTASHLSHCSPIQVVNSEKGVKQLTNSIMSTMRINSCSAMIQNPTT